MANRAEGCVNCARAERDARILARALARAVTRDGYLPPGRFLSPEERMIVETYTVGALE